MLYIIFSGVGFAIGGFSGIDYIVMQIHYAKAMKRRYFMRYLAVSIKTWQESIILFSKSLNSYYPDIMLSIFG